VSLRSIAVASLVLLSLGPLTASPAAAIDATALCTFDVQALPEVSGMTPSIRHKGVLWVHNDSSGGPVIYAMDAETCAIRATITLADMPGRDMEAIATGRDAAGAPVIWVGDFGDNKDSYEFVRLYQVPEPKELVDQTVPARAWRFTYPDGPHNAETLLVDPRKPRLWVVTKGLAAGVMYKFPDLPDLELGEAWKDPLVLERVQDTGGLISDGAVSQDASRYATRDYINAQVYDGLPPGKAITTVELPAQPQGEALAWAADGKSLLVAGERDGTLWSVRLPRDAWTAAALKAEAALASEGESGPEAESSGEGESPMSFTTLIGLIVVGVAIAGVLVGSRLFRR
jgi:hypothetical protein